jgi:hypothetical protein
MKSCSSAQAPLACCRRLWCTLVFYRGGLRSCFRQTPTRTRRNAFASPRRLCSTDTSGQGTDVRHGSPPTAVARWSAQRFAATPACDLEWMGVRRSSPWCRLSCRHASTSDRNRSLPRHATLGDTQGRLDGPCVRRRSCRAALEVFGLVALKRSRRVLRFASCSMSTCNFARPSTLEMAPRRASCSRATRGQPARTGHVRGLRATPRGSAGMKAPTAYATGCFACATSQSART